MRLRPFFLSHVLLIAGGVLAQPAVAEGPRWTPLTGLLAPPAPATPTETSSFQKPERPKGASAQSVSGVATLPLKITLGRTDVDGQPRGDLGVQTIAVDGDLAQALELGQKRGALVTRAASTATGAAGLLVGDIIATLDGRAVAGPDDLLSALRSTSSGRQVTVEVHRAGKGAADLKALLVERADDGNISAAASLGRLLSLGAVLGRRNYGDAGRYYLKAAEAGHVVSMTRYALLAKDGIGMRKDEALAAQWFRKAAEGGQDAAMTNLGSLYETGRGVKRDYAEAARWYRAAVDKGQVSAIHRLALMYETGRGVKKDDQEAVKLLRRASDAGLSEATSWLADKYEQGRGIAKDETEAYQLNRRAADQVRRTAEQGNAVATFNLGILYRTGKGVDRSDAEAAYWVVRSLKLGDKYLVAELMRNPDVLSAADRKWLQEVLRDEGAYTGPINGTFSPAVRAAMEALASRA